MDLARELTEQLGCKIKFVIPIFGGIPVPDSVFVSWIIMAALAAASLLMTRKLRLIPTGAQLYVEALVGFLNSFMKDTLGKHWRTYAPWLGTVALYIGFANLIGIFGLTPPTKDLNVTAGLALTSVVIIYGSALRSRGPKGFVHMFIEPMPLVAPLNIMEIAIRPLSLCMRLFGNVLGAFVVMELVKIVAPVIIPIPLSMYFDVFDGLIQTIVFVFLTTLFIKESIE